MPCKKCEAARAEYHRVADTVDAETQRVRNAAAAEYERVVAAHRKHRGVA